MAQNMTAAASTALYTLSAARPAIDTATRAVTSAAARIPWAQLHEKARTWIVANPRQSGLLVVQGAVFILPGMFFVPLLSISGFTSLGPQACSIAATTQSLIGSVPARGIFAHLQSAAMGGYGAAVVSTGVRIMAGGTALASNMASKLFRSG